MTIKAKDSGRPSLVSDNSATLRLDMFKPTEVLVSMHLGISKDDFHSKKKLFIDLLTTLLREEYSTGKFKVWCVEESETGTKKPAPAQPMRRLTTDHRSVMVYIYCLKSNMTDSEINIGKDKDFCTVEEALSFLTVNDQGDMSIALKGPVWKDFNIEDIKGFTAERKQWFYTSKGKITLAVIIVCTLVLICLIIFLVHQYKRLKKKRLVAPVTRGSEANNRSNKTHLFNLFGKNRVKCDDNSMNFSFQPRIHFDDNIPVRGFYTGRAIDPVSGKLYEYDKQTGERRWFSS
ncbi:hypothetical protein Ahia01_000611000 [Argonauta hians]